MARRLLSLEDEIEGDYMGGMDFFFCRIGDPVRLLPTLSNSRFDLSDPPLQPLAVSERHRLLFLAHSKGFFVANTKDVIGLAKEKERGSCIQKSCVVDVHIGRVSILSLSGDSLLLAATVGRDIHLFSVQSLLDKVKEPAISATLKESGIVKDLKWRRNSVNSFVVLTIDGSLCHRSSGLQLKDVIDNVDAVDWSVDGNFVSIARKDTVSILTSNFEEILGMQLLFQSWIVDSGSEIKVDSIKWVRHDSIVIGCTQFKEDSEDYKYIVQVITTGGNNLTEVSCKPLVYSFPDFFVGLTVDMLPTEVGPCLISEYLDRWGVAFVSNKKNADQHISLLRWIAGENGYEVASLELGSDKYIPRIELQDDGDDNLILGFAVDKISLYEKIKIQQNLEFKELSPQCILLCLTCDGMLTLYHAATTRIFEPSDLPKLVSTHGNNIVNGVLCTSLSAEGVLGVTTPRLNGEQQAAISANFNSSSDKPDIGSCVVEQLSHSGSGMITFGYSMQPDIEVPNMFSNAGDLGTSLSISEIANESLAVKGSNAGETIVSDFTVGPLFEPQIAQKPFGINFSNASASSTAEENVTTKSFGPSIVQGHSSVSETSMPFGSKTKIILSSAGESNLSGAVNEAIYSSPSNSPPDFPSCTQPFGTLGSSEKIIHSGLPAPDKLGYIGKSSSLNGSSVVSLAKLPGPRQHLPLANSTSSKPHLILEFEPQSSKHFYNVKDVTKELDALLSSIECEGGFKDLCSVIQEQSLLVLEAGLDNLSELLFGYRSKVESQVMKIQLLHNKMLEVSAREVYMDCIVQQASDSRYWDIWNAQKLSPEFEAKRLHILNLKQNLTNQLVELERHFNSLEIVRFGENNAAPSGWRASSGSPSSSRRTQSLYSVYRTVNSQLAAAERLSECLSKQMAMLNMTSPTLAKRNFTRELFQSIGLDHKIDAFMTADPNSLKSVPYSSNNSSLSSTTSKEHSWKSASTPSKVVESARRKSDSLNKGWAHFEPSRTTIKRTSKKERARSNLDITFREAKDVFDSQVKAFDLARTELHDASTASSEPFGITKRTNVRATSSYSQSVEHSPSEGIQEKSSKKAIAGQSKSLFKWAKDSSYPSSEPNAVSTSHSSHVFRSATSQPSLSTAPATFSNFGSNKDEKPCLPFMFNMITSSAVNQSSSSVTKAALESKSKSVSIHQKFSDSVSSVKTASASEKTSHLYQETSLKNEVDIPANQTHASTKNSAVSSNTLSSSIAQSSVSLPSSSLPSLQFGKPMMPSNLLSSNKSNAPSLFSTELASKSVPFLASVHSSDISRSSNEIDSELVHATSQSTNTADSAKELSSELKTDTSQASTPAIIIAPSTLPSVTSVSVFPEVSDSRPKARSIWEISSSIMIAEKDEPLDDNLSREDEMEEEAVDTNSVLNFESLGGSSLQSTPSSNVLKTNPFGTAFAAPSTGSTSPQLSWSTSPGQLFRPQSFNLPESQPSQSAGPSSLTGVASGGFSGFGQPAQLGAGQQALGSVLGSFGQSRQLGAGMPGFSFASSGIPAAGNSGGSTTVGGFVGAATGGGFAGLSPNTGGFAGLSPNTGGFAGLAPNAGGFAGAAALSGGFARAASAGGGFGAASSGSGFSSGGFGGFSNVQHGGFSGFGAGKSSAGRPPAELLTQMRK